MTTANPNVDFGEIAKFEELASRWWDPDSEFKPLHDINPLRLHYIDERAGGLSGKRTLDVGCGGGILAESMALRGAQVIGIDMGEAPLAVARLHQLESGAVLDYRRTTAEELAENEPASFDIVTCMEMLEHVPDPASTIRACARLLKPDGHAFFSTINRPPSTALRKLIYSPSSARNTCCGCYQKARTTTASSSDPRSSTAGCEPPGWHFGISSACTITPYSAAIRWDLGYRSTTWFIVGRTIRHDRSCGPRRPAHLPTSPRPPAYCSIWTVRCWTPPRIWQRR